MATKPSPFKPSQGLSAFERYLTVWFCCALPRASVWGVSHRASRPFSTGSPYMLVMRRCLDSDCDLFVLHDVPHHGQNRLCRGHSSGEKRPSVTYLIYQLGHPKPFTMYAIAVLFLGTFFLDLIGPDAVDHVKMPFGLNLPVGSSYGSGTVVVIDGIKDVGGAAVAQLSGRLYPARHRALYGHGPGLGLSGQRE